MNINYDEEKNLYSFTNKIMTQIVSKQDEMTMKAIKEYCEKNGYIPQIIEKEKLDLILKLGINEYQKRFKGE